MGWPIERAIKEFARLSNQAFSRRDWLGIPIYRNPAQLLFSYRFRSDPINPALQEAFGQGLLFGPSESITSDKVKVGVLAAIPGGRRPYLFANYSRNPTGQNTDYLVREDDLEDELKKWEAARSTSAAPTYFRPFYHKAKRQQYIDGALHRNNPVEIVEQERRATWRDRVPPDIILSVGTGIQVNEGGTAKFAGERIILKGLRRRLAVGLDVIQSTLDCNRQWDEFIKSTEWDRDISSACHRLNIGLVSRPPNLDDIRAMADLEREARRYMEPEHRPYLNGRYKSAHDHIKVVAQRLTAALFYFEEVESDDEGQCTGILHCRLGSAMRDKFRHFLSAKPSFRAISRNPGGSWYSSGLSPVFDEYTFSSKIDFHVRSNRKVIELMLPNWRSWVRISGFSSRR